jgi:glycosyltransferase involved in cell wall biosynthesis
MSNQDEPGPQSPLLSVIIPAFNAAGYVGAALQSVFAQTFTDYEVILVNDGSSDTEQLEQVIRPYRSRITYLTQENRGPSGARNLGIRHARGEWLAFLDSDDIWMENYLAEQLRFLATDRALDMAYCDATLEGETGAVGKTFMQLCPSSGPVTFESLLEEETQVLTSGTVVRRKKVIEAGLFDEEIHRSEDHDLWLRIVFGGGKISYQRVVLLRRNVRVGSQGSAPESLLAGEIQTLTKLDRELDLSPSTRDLLRQRLRKIQGAFDLIEGKKYLLVGERQKAYDSLSRARAVAPSARLWIALAALRVAPGLTIEAARLWHRRNSRPGRLA